MNRSRTNEETRVKDVQRDMDKEGTSTFGQVRDTVTRDEPEEKEVYNRLERGSKLSLETGLQEEFV